MTLPWSVPTIRARLTAWYALALTAMMIVYATATFIAVRHEFLEQLDERLHDDFEVAEGRLTRTADGHVAWATGHEDGRDDEARVYEIWSGTGEQIHRSGAPASLPPIALATTGSSYRYETIVANGERWRSIAAPVAIGGHNVVLRVSRSEERVREQLGEVLAVLVLGLPLVVALAGVGGYLLARRALAPIDHLASEARRITAERLHERLKVPNPRDEIGRLAAVMNEAFARLESSFDQLRRFTADSSHELRTPLAVVRGIGEAAVAGRRSPAEYEEAIGSMLEEVDRMSTLVDTLLRLSHADAGTIRLSREPLDLGRLARGVASSLGILAEERSQTLALEVTEGVVLAVDRLVLREALSNVLDNAIKYSPEGSTITIRVERAADHALIAIGDQGPGIPAEYRDRIFHRFFRVDEARTRERGGAGLGLAIARWAIEIHGGQITVDERPGGGSEFRIRLSFDRSEARLQDVRSEGGSMRRMIVVLLIVVGAAVMTQAETRKLDFNQDAVEQPPKGFEFAHTAAVGKPGKWIVQADGTNKVLAQTDPDSTRSRFPVAVVSDISAADVDLSVRVKPISGRVDQAAGLVWRYQNQDNYYIVRANALEDNVVLYKVEGGKRTDLPLKGEGRTYGKKTDVPAGQWSTLRVVAVGRLFAVYFNGSKLYEVDDATFSKPGKVGVWTKADSVTQFDDLTVVTK